MKTVHAVVTNPGKEGICSWYRSWGVWPRIKSIKFEDAPQMFAWFSLANTDVMYLERPFMQQHLQIIQLMKQFKIPVVIDYDDDLFKVDPSNKAAQFFNNPQTQQIMITCIQLADAITVATEAIKKSFSLFTDEKKIHVIPNAFNNYFFQLPEEPGANPIINWRGGDSHLLDMMEVTGAIKEIHAAVAENKWKFSFMGAKAYQVLMMQHLPEFYFHGEMENFNYHVNQANLKSAIQIYPLRDIEFNKAKSNCVWLECSMAGSVLVAPDFPEFNKPGIVNYKTPAELAARVIELANNPELRKQKYLESKRYIEENLLVSITNKLREDVINSL